MINTSDEDYSLHFKIMPKGYGKAYYELEKNVKELKKENKYLKKELKKMNCYIYHIQKYLLMERFDEDEN